MKLRFCLSEFAKYIQEPSARLTRLWLATFISVESIATSMIDPQTIFQRISKEMSMAPIDKVRCYLEIGLYLSRRNPNLTDMFVTQVLEQAKGEINEVLIRWLPTIIMACGKVPDKLMLHLARLSATDVILMAKHAKYSGTQNIQAAVDEFLERLAMVKDMPRSISAYEKTFKWVSQCQDDIHELKNIIEAHENFYKAATAEEVNPDNLRELARVCDQYRPVFTTQRFQTNMSLTWVTFHMLGQNVAQITVRSNRVDEAQMLVTSSTGEVNSYALVSPQLYHFSHSEMFFVQAVQKMMQSHPSSCEKARCLSYPFTILLDPNLMMVFFNTIFSQQTLCRPMLPSLFAEARLATDRDECLSPVGVREKRRIDVDRGFYARKVTEFASGRKLEFLQARSCLASHLAAFSVINFIFGASLPTMPSLCLPKYPMRLTIPGFFKFLDKGPLLPLTPSIRELLPPYLLKGVFTTTWHVMADAIGRHPEKMKITIAALGPRDLPIEKCMEFLARARKLSVQVATETEKLDEPFPFILLDHLIDTAANTMDACESPYSWI